MAPKPIQIAVSPEYEGTYERLYVLCDDGSIWLLTEPGIQDIWRSLPGIPQPLESDMWTGPGPTPPGWRSKPHEDIP
jgi:hypothetical protein